MDLSLDHWERMSARERQSTAARIAKTLPTGFQFDSIQTFRLGAREHEVAFFRFGADKFALIPTGAVSIGFDNQRRWEPTTEELESWQGTTEEYGINKPLREYLAEVTLQRRTVEMAPFLMETRSAELGWEAVALDDPEVREIAAEYGLGTEVCRAGVSVRIRTTAEGRIVAERSRACTHPQLAREFRSAGFRFPSSDEWEYACGCGEPTLFRWGDHVPCDCYPTDTRSSWDIHRRPNAFGMSIASDPYKYELVAELDRSRGGDGGGMICGGAGFFVAWLTLATAYFEEHSCRHDPVEPIAQGYTVGRRVLPLD